MPFDYHGYRPNYQRKRKKPSMRFIFSKPFALLLIFVLGVLAWLGPVDNQVANIFSKTGNIKLDSKNVLSESEAEKKKEPEIPKEAISRQELIERLNEIMVVNGDYSISIENLKTGQTFGINELTPYHAASTMKVLVAVTVLSEVEAGRLSFDTVLSGYTVKRHLELMINRSSNDSWHIFYSALSYARVQEMADQLGLSGVIVNQNQATTDSMRKLLSEVYNGKILKKENKELLFSYMQNTNVENRLTPGVPSGVKIYHKEGSLEARLHDVGIVEHPRFPYVIAIYTKSGEQQARLKAFQDASKAVYEYFDGLN